MSLHVTRLLSAAVLAAAVFAAIPASAAPVFAAIPASAAPVFAVANVTAQVQDVPSEDEQPPGGVTAPTDDVDVQDSNGWWKGYPVAVRIWVTGDGTRVDTIKVRERWDGLINDSRYGHTEIYYREGDSNHHIGNSSNHWLGGNLTSGEYNNNPHRNYPDGSLMCARWWSLINGQWKGDESSCVTIHS